jgi:hypothetical protein
MACSECERLQGKHKHLEMIWGNALKARIESLSHTPHVEHRRLTTNVNEAWLNAARAGQEFENHKKTHAEVT